MASQNLEHPAGSVFECYQTRSKLHNGYLGLSVLWADYFSGLNRDFSKDLCCPGGIASRIKCDVEYGSLADRHAGKTSKVDSAVRKGLCQHHAQTSLVISNNSDSADGFAFVKSKLFGCFGLSDTLDGSDKHHGFFRLIRCAPGEKKA